MLNNILAERRSCMEASYIEITTYSCVDEECKGADLECGYGLP